MGNRPSLLASGSSSSHPAQHRAMGNAISGAAAPALCAALSALELVSFLDQQRGAGTMAAAQAPALHGAARVLLPLAAAGGLFASAALVYRHVHQDAAAAGAGNRRLSELVTFALCASAGFLFLFVAQGPGGVDHGAGRALGLAALRALPAAATMSFFLGISLIIVRHIRAGGEGGGGAVAGDGPIEAPVGLLAKMTIGAAAGLVCLMAMACLYGA